MVCSATFEIANKQRALQPALFQLDLAVVAVVEFRHGVVLVLVIKLTSFRIINLSVANITEIKLKQICFISVYTTALSRHSTRCCEKIVGFLHAAQRT